MSYTIGAFVGV